MKNKMIAHIHDDIMQGRLHDAESKCLEILADPHSLSNKNYLLERSEIYELLGDISQKKNQLNETITYYLNALNLNANDDLWVKFANSIKYAQFSSYHPQIEQKILEGLSKNHISSQHFAFPGISLLKLSSDYTSIPEILSTEASFQWIEKAIHSHSLSILENRLLLELTEKTILPDGEIEKLLTHARKALLKNAVPLGNHKSNYFIDHYYRFLYPLAMQCFHNEYIYFETDEETAWIDKLIASLPVIHSLNELDLSTKALITLIGCYRPLYRLPIAKGLVRLDIQEEEDKFHALIINQIQGPLREERLCGAIPSLNPISDEISLKVQDQYEENPYPRWTLVDKKLPKSIQEILKEQFPHNLLEDHFPENPEILIAGCGTGQHAINCANSYKNSKILAIDLSKRSLAYATSKANDFGISNIHFLQADILDLSRLNSTFDVIECVGVLHHMQSPLKGWKILADLLKPNGLMIIGLYSKLARQDIQAARFFIQKHGYQPTLREIRECRQHIFRLPNHDPIHQLSSGVDFYTTSSCRDLLFHVQEHQFTLPQIKENLQELGLSFIGFELKNPDTLDKFLNEFPNDPQAHSLDNWNIFEQKNPDTFVGMYCLWLQKKSFDCMKFF